ncbi:MAG: hypothetical protein IPP31_00700 [Chitinophagaceae bacterium]|nr:hypothetical protein [Chitinophagaceae bacterium]
MKNICFASLFLILLGSCGPGAEKTVAPIQQAASDSAKASAEKQRFFPVTDYLKGQLFEISKKEVTPLKYITIGDHTDSVWLKREEVGPEVKEFLTPQIDSMNLIGLFTEKKFMDQTLDALTFTYEPTSTIPDSLKLQRWDIYVDPNTGKVRRIYLVKTAGENRILQLTWLSDKWCKMTTINSRPDGSSVVEREEKIVWDF